MESLLRQGVGALQQGRPAEARGLFEEVTRNSSGNAQAWLLLATACRMEQDSAAEEAAIDRLMAMAPRIVRAHIMKADCRARAGDENAALGFYTSALMLASGERLPPELATEVKRAEAAANAIRSGFQQRREEMLSARGFSREKRSARFQQSLELMAGDKQIYFQQPTGYYFPELPQIQYFDTAQFDWVPEVEAATAAIREELAAILSTGLEGFIPYIRSDSNQPRLDENRLLDSKDWSALFLVENGKLFDEVVARCPRTWEAVQRAPLPRIPNSPTAMFSLLRPGARIAPHTGTHNTRLVCHLPLIVPPGCAFRVGNEVREWEEGKMLIFDDTIEHEAWNKGGEDRVVLIFDIWRPELSEQEREEVAILLGGQPA
jgi:aspartyl/asparaginyl beta-hydroxylase (cupin superfamily)